MYCGCHNLTQCKLTEIVLSQVNDKVILFSPENADVLIKNCAKNDRHSIRRCRCSHQVPCIQLDCCPLDEDIRFMQSDIVTTLLDSSTITLLIYTLVVLFIFLTGHSGVTKVCDNGPVGKKGCPSRGHCAIVLRNDETKECPSFY